MSQPTRGRMMGGLVAAIAATASLALASCASNGSTAPKSSGGATSAATSPSASSPGSQTASSSSVAAGGGGVLKGEPDVNGDGKVVIGVLSPGDINDHGYYESFVDDAAAFAKAQHWQVIKRGSVQPTDALNAARALCQQHVDMVALGASELADALPASSEAVCAKTAWYVPSSNNIKQTPQIFLSSDDPNQDLLAAGYAAGLLMKAKHSTKAGFIAGPVADYSTLAAKAFLAGIREVVPSATVIKTFDGDANDSAKGKEAAQAQISQKVSVIYPYLGGSTDAVTTLANANHVDALTPGTDRCASKAPKFAISVLFSPGDYFLAALQKFKAGTLAMGVSKIWTMGKDPFPTVKMCNPTSSQAAQLTAFLAKIGNGTIVATKEVNRLGK